MITKKLLAASEVQPRDTPKWESISTWLNYGAAYATSIASHEDMVIADEDTGFDIECLKILSG